MYKFNTIIFYVGIIMTAIGMLVGFPIMMFGNQHIAMILISMVAPFGFLLFFTGFIGSITVRAEGNKTREDYENHKKAETYQKTVPD